ncbi:MAG: hypothetical protein IIW91_01990 [Alistipes sp.]|nr:hypothetical protein [Alistipes sp.]
MRRILSIITVMAFVGILFAQEAAVRRVMPTSSASVQATQTQQTTSQRRRVDFMADVVRPYNHATDSIVYLVGNFAAHHNGAVISCDSAVRYSDTRWGFFNRLLINQDSIYIYGDSALYDGERGVAEIYAPIVKVVDGDALLYTYNFMFNTSSRVGNYTGGGVLVHDNNIIESQRGYYYSESHDIICVEDVELHGADYDMKSDSIIYNTDSEMAHFFTSSEIWNVDGDYLSADAGMYDMAQDLYMVTRNGYILTKDQELWGDTLSYYRTSGYVEGRGNIQMDDFKEKMMAFGDYAEYWQDPGNMLLTRRPSVISYDLSQSDSVFMRADTISVRTISVLEERAAAEKAAAEKAAAEAQQTAPRQNTPSSQPTKSSAAQQAVTAEDADVDYEDDQMLSEEQPADSVQKDSVVLSDKELRAQIKAQAKAEARKAKEEAQKVKAAARKLKLDSIARIRQAKVTAMLDRQKAKELARYQKDSVRRAERRAKLVSRGRDVSLLDREDSLAGVARERLLSGPMPLKDTMPKPQAEPEIAEDTIATEEKVDSIAADSVYRLIRAYRGVKMFRKDAQMVCDSLSSSSQDSVVRMYIDPVLWNGSNQLAATEMQLFTRNQQIERAEFLENPIMVGEVDGHYFNQVTGKKMIAFFRDNELYRDDVEGNVQTIYFRTVDEQSKEVIEMTYLESASASFYLEDQQLVGITYRNEVPFTLYPIGLLPATQPTELPNFKWVPERRPSLEDVFDRQIRESQRDKVAQRLRPTFRIVERMDRRKEALLMSGEWVDREDELSSEVVQWRDTRGL